MSNGNYEEMFRNVGRGFDGVNKKVGNLEDEMQKLDEKIGKLEGKVDDLDQKLDSFKIEVIKEIQISSSRTLNKFWMGAVVIAGVVVGATAFINNSNQTSLESASTQALLREMIRSEISAIQPQAPSPPAPAAPSSSSSSPAVSSPSQ